MNKSLMVLNLNLIGFSLARVAKIGVKRFGLQRILFGTRNACRSASKDLAMEQKGRHSGPVSHLIKNLTKSEIPISCGSL